MSEEKMLNKYIELINKGYCCACNELNCIDNFPQKKIANAISNLQQENQQLKEVIEEVRVYIEDSANQMSEDATYYLLQILDKGVKDE